MIVVYYNFEGSVARLFTTAGMQEVEQRRSSCREPGWARTVTPWRIQMAQL